MSFLRPTLTELIARAKNDIDGRLPGADSRLRRSVLGVVATISAGLVQGLYGYLDFLARQILPDTAEREHLERWASIFRITRKAATLATGDIAVTGVSGAVVPAGTVLQRTPSGLEYATQAKVTLVAGSGVVTVAAVTAGVASVAEPGVMLSFVSPVAGVASTVVVGAGGLIGGADQESDGLLRDRLLDRMRTAPAGGAKHDYKRWTLEVPEVTRAWIYPGWTGAGTVGIAFVMDGRANPIPTATDIATVIAHLAILAPVTAELVVFAPVATPLNLTITGLAPNDAPTRAAVIAELRDLLFREAEPGGVTLISHLREAVSLAAGEQDHVLTVPTSNVVRSPGQLTVLGAVTWG